LFLQVSGKPEANIQTKKLHGLVSTEILRRVGGGGISKLFDFGIIVLTYIHRNSV
jgi:hypothetical protein